MVNLSVGLGYIHHGLKRQAENRQYLIMQGLASVFEYSRASLPSESLEPAELREINFTVARAFHMLGLQHLAHNSYSKVLSSTAGLPVDTPGDGDTMVATLFNEYILLVTGRDLVALESLLLPRLIL